LSISNIRFKELFISNAQSITGNISIKLDGITVLVGPNSAGKSAINDAFEFLSMMDNPDFAWLLEQKFGKNAEIGIRFFYSNSYGRHKFRIDENDNTTFLKRFVGHEITIKISCFRYVIEVDGKQSFEISEGSVDDGFSGVIKYLFGKSIFMEDVLERFNLWDEDFPAVVTTNITMDEGFFDLFIEGLNADFNSADEFNSVISTNNILAKGQTEFKDGKLFLKSNDLANFQRGFFILNANVQRSLNWGHWNEDTGLSDELINHVKGIVDLNLPPGSKRRHLFYEQIVDQKYRIKNTSEVDELSALTNEVNQYCKSIGVEFARLLRDTISEMTHCVHGGRTIIQSSKPQATIFPFSFEGEKYKFSKSLLEQNGLELERSIASYCFELYRTLETSDWYHNPHSSFYSHDKKYLPPATLKKWMDSYLPSLSKQKVVPLFTSTSLVFERNSKIENYFSSKALSAKNKSDSNLPIKIDVYLKIKSPDNRFQDFADVGSGYSFIFPILTSLLSFRLSFVEQPELHLHPKLQGELADVFIAASKHSRNCVLETHSEHILLRFLRRIRETSAGKKIKNELRLVPDDLNIYFFEPRKRGTVVKKIRVDNDGDFLNLWPGGFFTEREVDIL